MALSTYIIFSWLITTNSFGVRLIERTSVFSGKAIISGNGWFDGCKRMTSTVNIAIKPKIIVAVRVVTSLLKNRRFAGSGWSAITSG